jgi:hypothetical protein
VAVPVAVALAARVLFLLFMPPSALSEDMQHWSEVAAVLENGGNPYNLTPHLNWPPLWMQLVFLLSKLSGWTGVPFHRCVQGFLILVDCLVIAAACRLCVRLGRERGVSRIVIGGLCLNPIPVLLTCQHGNFDALVGLLVLLFNLALLAHARSDEAVDWLWACLFLGLGALAKTVTLALAPLLLSGARRLSGHHVRLGALLCIGPAALGMSILYALGPREITEHVLSYRSYGGWFGFSGLLGAWSPLYVRLSPILILAALVLAGRFVWRTPRLEPRQQVLLCALCLMVLPALGPGYAPQYVAWFLPLLVCSYAVDGSASWRRLLLASYAVAAATYLFEYAFFESHGSFLVRIHPTRELLDFSLRWSTELPQALVRLPLFLCYLALLAFGARRVREAR